MSDDRERVRKLRAKAKDKAVTPEEAAALEAKADKIESKSPEAGGACQECGQDHSRVTAPTWIPPTAAGKRHVMSFTFYGTWPVVVVSARGFDANQFDVDGFVEDAYRFADEPYDGNHDE